MKHKIIYITEDNKEFDNQFEAKKHECEMTNHIWEFYNKGTGIKKEEEDAYMKFCKRCNKQVKLK